MKGRFVSLWTAAVVATALAFVVHLAMRFETVRLGYELSEAKKEQRHLVENRRLLAIEAQTLHDGTRVEAIARGTLAMDAPPDSRIISVTANRASKAAGRVR